MIAHIVAAARNDVIGVNNGLPWSLPEDMKFFRDTTKGKALIMGRKTYESVGHPLPKRLNVVISRQPGYVPAGALVAKDMAAALKICQEHAKEYGPDIFIIGGGEIFKSTMDIVDKIYLTRIHQDFPGDIVYPRVDENHFKLVERRDRTDPIAFSFLTYERK